MNRKEETISDMTRGQTDGLKTVVLGAGNVATHLSEAFVRAGHAVVQVFSRTAEHASELAVRLQTSWTTSTDAIRQDADLYVFAVSDDALESLIKAVRPNGGLWLHTAGSVPMDVFGTTARCGVLYPLQTFSRSRNVDFSRIPLFVEARQRDDEELLLNLARSLSSEVRVINSAQRKYLHLAAVFACNFANNMYAQAAEILKKADIPWQTLLPLIDETAAKVHNLTPLQAQTGPAVRNDRRVIEMQKALIEDAELKNIYELISNQIFKYSKYEQYKL